MAAFTFVVSSEFALVQVEKTSVISTGVMTSRSEAIAEWRDLLFPSNSGSLDSAKPEGFAPLEMTKLGNLNYLSHYLGIPVVDNASRFLQTERLQFESRLSHQEN